MASPLRVLLLEDQPTDAELVLHELRRAGFDLKWQRVDNEKDFREAIHSDIEIILADYSLPQYDAKRALQHLTESGLDLPFIVVTGSISEEVAVECMRRGAADYLLKDRLSRLGQAVSTALERQARRREKSAADAAARREKEFSERIINSSFDGIIAFDRNGTCTLWNSGMERISGLEGEFALGRMLADLMPFGVETGIGHLFEEALAGRNAIAEDCPYIFHQSGQEGFLEAQFSPLSNDGGQVTGGIAVIRDITERKLAAESLKRSEELHRTLARNLPDSMVFMFDRDMNYTLAEGSGLGRIGCSPEALPGHHYEEVLTKEVRDTFALDGHYKSALEGHIKVTEARHDGHTYRVHSLPVKNDEGEIFAGMSMLLDISAEKRAEAEIRALNARLERRLQRIMALRRVDTTITSTLDLRVILAVLLDEITANLGVSAAAILLYDPHTRTLEPAADRGFRTDLAGRARVRVGEGLTGRAVMERRRLNDQGVHETEDVSRREIMAAEGFTSHYAVPLIAKAEIRGVLDIFNRAPLEVDAEWIDFLDTLAGQAAIAIESMALFEDLQRSNINLALAYDTTIEGWSRALDLRDKETEGHSVRVTELTLRLARSMGIGAEELVHMRRGALLHDIGKMGVPDQILLKPGPLTDEEWVIMRCHPVYAYELISPISFLLRSMDIPYCHHEKWDGSGYPQGLIGEVIPLAARMFAVVDVWDALTSDRPYRKAWDRDRALDFIREQSGKHFDPVVVEAFERLHANPTAPDTGYLNSWRAAAIRA